MCGEQCKTSYLHVTAVGSSPRVRGTVDMKVGAHSHRGIIPACAGNSILVQEITQQFWDHPRVCGEQLSVYYQVVTHLGSSPRVRGTVGFSLGSFAATGIIPACAGNSKPGGRVSRGIGDHPRVCGEQLSLTDIVIISQGIIPACAGNSPVFASE